ncbi:hypothetical protein EJ03DRAFT_328387, partial [Teratosphaeria nubilosa]
MHLPTLLLLTLLTTASVTADAQCAGKPDNTPCKVHVAVSAAYLSRWMEYVRGRSASARGVLRGVARAAREGM